MTVDEYLAAAPQPQATTLRTLRGQLLELLPEAEEKKNGSSSETRNKNS